MLQLANGISQDRVLIDSFFEGAVYPFQEAIEYIQNERAPFVFYGISITAGFRTQVLGFLVTGSFYCLFRLARDKGWLELMLHRLSQASQIEAHVANVSYNETGSLQV